MTVPFTVLHVCMGNICRSPMAERLLVLRLREALGPVADELVRSHGAGTGFWHEGNPMNPPAARQLLARGGSTAGFTARGLIAEHLRESDLVLAATSEQVEFAVDLAPEAADRTFVLGEFARLVSVIPTDSLPPFAPTAEAVAARGRAMVVAVNNARANTPPEPGDDLDDPYGRADSFFSGTADQVDASIDPLVRVLAGR